MSDDRRNTFSLEAEGVYFTPDELAALCACKLPGVRVEIVATASAYEEVAVFRRRRTPATILGTLHKRPDGTMIVSELREGRLFTPPSARTAFADLAQALPALLELLRF